MTTANRTASAMIPLVLATFSAKCQVPRLLMSCRLKPRLERILDIEAVQIQEPPHGQLATVDSLVCTGNGLSIYEPNQHATSRHHGHFVGETSV